MLDRLRAHLTYANVMSSIAVFVALSGGVAYAAEQWTGEDIYDGTITGADIQGNLPDAQNAFVDGSLTTEDIRNGTLFPIDLANDSIGGDKIAADALGTGDIAGLNGGDIADDSLDGFDIQNLSGADLIDGSVGAADLAPDARGFSRVTTRSKTERLNRGDRANEVVNCPAGWTAISGGYGHSAERHPDDFAVSSFGRHSARGWQVVGRHVGGAGADRLFLHVSVVCAR